MQSYISMNCVFTFSFRIMPSIAQGAKHAIKSLEKKENQYSIMKLPNNHQYGFWTKVHLLQLVMAVTNLPWHPRLLFWFDALINTHHGSTPKFLTPYNTWNPHPHICSYTSICITISTPFLSLFNLLFFLMGYKRYNLWQS